MEVSEEKPTFKVMLNEWLRKIDAEFSNAGLSISDRPLHAAIEFVNRAVPYVDVSVDGPVEPPRGIDMVVEPWFRIVYQHVARWYEKRYGARAKPPPRGIKGVVLVMGVPTLVNVPSSIARPDVPGETIWVSFPAVVDAEEKPMDWLVDAPDLTTGDPDDATRAHKLVNEVVGAIRAINCRLMGVPRSAPEISELLEGVIPGLERAAELLVKGGEHNLKSAHWELQMAVERAFKALSQERSGRFDEIHDLFLLFDRLAEPPLDVKRDQLKKLPNWRTMAELRYGRGPAVTIAETFTVYRAALKIVRAIAEGFKGVDLSEARFNIGQAPWTRPIEEYFTTRRPDAGEPDQVDSTPPTAENV